MKSFRKLVSEVAQPKAGDEARFKAKHVVDPKTHPVAPDNMFTGGTVRSPKRRADREKGEDEAVYEGSFDVPTAEGGEHDSEDSHTKYKKGNKSSKTMKEAKKLDPVGKADADIDNDGDVDSSDKYLHARRRAISKAIKKEATDTQMGTITVTSDEERKKRAQMYRDKKATSMKKEEVESLDESGWGDDLVFRGMYTTDPSGIPDYSRKTEKGKKSEAQKNLPKLKNAIKRQLGRHPKPRLPEEVEQVDEVLKSTTPMGTWIKDFQKSKAPQFKGKPQEKRRQMAIAAKYGAEREAGMREEVELGEDAWEEVPMMMSQLEFICYAAEEIMDYLDMGIDPEEWYQNKLANAYQTMMSLYSYARGEMRMSSRSGNGYDDMYGESEEHRKAKAGLSEQDKISESTELVEVFNQGIVKLKDGGSVILKKEDADLLNQMFKDLSSTNRKKMQEIAMKDKAGFNEILSFAREAL